MISEARVSTKVQIGLELQRAIAEDNGNAAVTALADLIRLEGLKVSESALSLLVDAARSGPHS